MMFVKLKLLNIVFRIMHFGAMPSWVELWICPVPSHARGISKYLPSINWTIILSKYIIYPIPYNLC